MINKYGLDTRYFKEKLKLIVRDIQHYSPDELERSLKRLADVAHEQHLKRFNLNDTSNQRSGQ